MGQIIFFDFKGQLVENQSKRINTMVHIYRSQDQKLFWMWTDIHDPYKCKKNWNRRTSARLLKSRCEVLPN